MVGRNSSGKFILVKYNKGTNKATYWRHLYHSWCTVRLVIQVTLLLHDLNFSILILWLFHVGTLLSTVVLWIIKITVLGNLASVVSNVRLLCMGDKMIWIHTEICMEIICMGLEIMACWWLSWKEWRVQRVQFSESDVQDAFDVIFIFLMDHAHCLNIYHAERVSRMFPRPYSTLQHSEPIVFIIYIWFSNRGDDFIVHDSVSCKHNCHHFSFCILLHLWRTCCLCSLPYSESWSWVLVAKIPKEKINPKT